MDISYIINVLGEEQHESIQDVAPPLHQTSNFSYDSVKTMRNAIQNEYDNYLYTRGNNPTLALLRLKLAALEGAEDALLFASGSAAIAAAVLNVVKAGDHIISVQQPYSWTRNLFSLFLAKFGVTVTYIAEFSEQVLNQSLNHNTRLIYLETPNSFTFGVQPIESICTWAKEKGLYVFVDNSYNSPLGQTPIALGADLVMHSATKYICGGSDAVAGVICGNKKLLNSIFKSELMTLGGIISPFNAWMLLKGLRTLPLRLKASSDNAAFIVNHLKDHPKVERFYYPMHPESTDYEIANKQMKYSGGLFSLAINGTLPQVETFCNSLKRFRLAVSWGGYESLAYPACAALSGHSDEQTHNFNIVRFYAGLEDKTVLLADINQALNAIK